MAPITLPLFLTTITLLLLHHHQPLITTASPLSPISLFANTNTTTPAVHAPSNNIQCVESPDWVTGRFFPYDCFSAIGRFQHNEVDRHSSTLYEFLSAGLSPLYPQFSQRTPRKYTYQSCTMAIVMLADLPHGLPGLPPPAESWTRTDMCDYVSIETAVLNVRDGCLSIVLDRETEGKEGGDGDRGKGEGKGKGKGKGRAGGVGFVNPVGYDTVGMHGAIGVFLWDTDSMMNRAVVGPVEFGNVNRTAGVSGVGGGTRVVRIS